MQEYDAELAERLRATHDDHPPAALLAAARAAYSWRTLDTDLCRPSYDSLLDEALTAVRGPQDARLLRFQSGGLALDVEVIADGATRSVVGQVTPLAPVRVTVRHGGAAEAHAGSDELGRFVVNDLQAGPLSVRCTADDGQLCTDWVLI